MREKRHMCANRFAIGGLLLYGVLASPAATSPTLAGEAAATIVSPTFSATARASIRATIVERPSMSCDRVARAVTVEIIAVPPTAGHHGHAAAIPRFSCSFIESMLNAVVEMAPEVTTPARPVRAGTNSILWNGGPGPPGHQHAVEIIYNFE